jgi:hypothetical protein
VAKWWLVLLAGCSFEHAQVVGSKPGELPDAPVGKLDAATLDCAGYTTITTLSRYRVIATPTTFAAQHAACNADGPGAHLASFETADEIYELQRALLVVGAGQYYVGAVQKPNSTSETQGWYVFTGGPLPEAMWGSSNDDHAGEDNEENLACLNTADLFHDVTGDVPYAAVCECDGRPIDPVVAGYIP